MRIQADTVARQRRYAMLRLRLAMQRMIAAELGPERTLARRWVIAWSAAIGERRFVRMGYDVTDPTRLS
ncbi:MULTISPECIES: hypothetical protein [unclassified Paraburkholderia]|uniref:hypothetical protein n=1 Tax=unclassified Paraburkholderia TaxID=2615204 RepID=UPI002AB13B8E|nr:MULTISPECIES: hypothetical protein [unclassified Paraburkholderia]